MSQTNIAMKHRKKHGIRSPNQDNQSSKSVCPCPKWIQYLSMHPMTSRTLNTQSRDKYPLTDQSNATFASIYVQAWPSSRPQRSRHFVDPAFRLMRFLLDGELDFYFEKLIYWLRKWLGVATYFCFIFKGVNKIRKKTLGVTPCFGNGWSTKNRIGFGGQVTYREGTVKTVAPL